MSTLRLRLAHLLFVSTLLAPASVGFAQGTTTRPTTQKSQHDREMTVAPAKAEDAVPPGQKADPFALSQDALPLRQENAATLYLQAISALPDTSTLHDEQYGARYDELMAASPDSFDEAKAEELLKPFQLTFALSERAVVRAGCDWGAPLEELGIETLLPYLNNVRVMANFMTLQARLHLARGEVDAAREMLRRVFIMAQHTGNAKQPVLVDGLVGVGVAAQAVEEARRMSERPSAPNQYWALSTLPSPMFDVPKWIRSERVFLTVSLPALRDPENMTSEEWTVTLKKFREYMAPDDNNASTLERLISDNAANAQMAADARPYLKARGYSDERLDEMGVPAVLATYMMDDYRSRFDAIAKLVYLPFPQALPLIVEQEKRMTRARGEPGPGLLADTLLPAMSKALAAPYRLERQIAALRIVEAVRDHAAHHEGALPATLKDVRLPIPEDPMTGQAFGYEVSGNTFTITARRYLPDDLNSGFNWRVTMRK